jgi:hypothetical protein
VKVRHGIINFFVSIINGSIAGIMKPSLLAPTSSSSPSKATSTLGINSPKAFWKVVALGFLPLFSSLHKRLTGRDEESLCYYYDVYEEESVYPSTSKGLLQSIEIRGDVPDVESVSDISDSSYSSESTVSSTSSYSDYTSASSGGSMEDPDLHYDSSSRFSSRATHKRSIGVSRATHKRSIGVKSGLASDSSLSNSFYDFARKTEKNYQGNSNNDRHLGVGMTRVSRLVKKFSRVVLRSDDCHHTV